MTQAIFDEHHLTQAYLFRLRLERKIKLMWDVFNPVDHQADHGQMSALTTMILLGPIFFWQTHTHCAHAAVATHTTYVLDTLPCLSESSISCDALGQYLFHVGQLACLSKVTANLH